MTRTAKRSRARNEPLDDLRARIREAEKAQRIFVREQVALDAESFETLAVLVERGAGRKSEVLREALKVGLKGMLRAVPGSDRDGATAALGLDARFLEFPVPPVPHETSALVNGVVPNGLALAMGVTVPPSVARRAAEAEGEEGGDDA